MVILASVFGLCKPYSWKRVLGKNKSYNFCFATCPIIDANLYAAKFENTKATMAILAKKTRLYFPRHIQLNKETKRTEPRAQIVVVNLTTVNGLRV